MHDESVATNASQDDSGGRDVGAGGAWGSVSYAGDSAEVNWTSSNNWTSQEFLEMMLGPKQVRELTTSCIHPYEISHFDRCPIV